MTYRLFYIPEYINNELCFGDYDTEAEAKNTGELLVCCKYRIEEIQNAN